MNLTLRDCLSTAPTDADRRQTSASELPQACQEKIDVSAETSGRSDTRAFLNPAIRRLGRSSGRNARTRIRWLGQQALLCLWRQRKWVQSRSNGRVAILRGQSLEFYWSPICQGVKRQSAAVLPENEIETLRPVAISAGRQHKLQDCLESKAAICSSSHLVYQELIKEQSESTEMPMTYLMYEPTKCFVQSHDCKKPMFSQLSSLGRSIAPIGVITDHTLRQRTLRNWRRRCRRRKKTGRRPAPTPRLTRQPSITARA